MNATDQRPAAILLSARGVARRLSVSGRQVWRLVPADHVPKPIQLGERVTRWRAADIAEHIERIAQDGER